MIEPNNEPRELESGVQPPPEPLLRLQEKYAFMPSPITERPKRCRAIIYNQTGDKVLGINRVRPGRDPYVVYPGGGLEESDQKAVDGIWRELQEELGISRDDIILTGSVIELEGEFFYLGYERHKIVNLTIGGPEAERDTAVSGSYEPAWHNTTSLIVDNMFPSEISERIEETA